MPKDEPERDCDNHGDEHRYNRVHHMLTQRDEQTVRSRPIDAVVSQLGTSPTLGSPLPRVAAINEEPPAATGRQPEAQQYERIENERQENEHHQPHQDRGGIAGYSRS